MQLVSGYMHDETLRHALNELTRKTFWFDFENWVTGGYFEGDYIPYSFLENGKIIANVSANRMLFLQNGTEKNYIQIGTVMTDEAYRSRGLAKKLMEHVIRQYKDTCDGFYLFANLSALDFYRKCGFTEEAEYCYFLKPEYCHQKQFGAAFRRVEAGDHRLKQHYMDAVRSSAVNSSMEQLNKFGLHMFYTADMEQIYYAEDIDCFIAAETEGDTLLLQSVICKNQVSLSEILPRIRMKYDQCRLGFAPRQADRAMCMEERYDGGEDYRLFCLGEKMKGLEQEKIYFPEFSHA